MTPQPALSLLVGDPARAPRVFDLEQPRTDTMPIHPAHRPGYSYVLHRRHQDSYGQDGPRTGASGMIVCMEHTGTHIDALSHQADQLVLCGGIPVDAQVQTSRGFTQHGVEQIPPIVAPGVLLDLPAHFGVAAFAAGDVVLVYTGNEQTWGDPERYLAGPGMAADASRWLAERGVVAVGADNMAWDVLGLRDPELGCTL